MANTINYKVRRNSNIKIKQTGNGSKKIVLATPSGSRIRIKKA